MWGFYWNIFVFYILIQDFLLEKDGNSVIHFYIFCQPAPLIPDLVIPSQTSSSSAHPHVAQSPDHNLPAHLTIITPN